MDVDLNTQSLDALLTEQSIDCPYCGEVISILIDHDNLPASYIEDCQVCCQPIQINISIDRDASEGAIAVIDVHRDNE